MQIFFLLALFFRFRFIVWPMTAFHHRGLRTVRNGRSAIRLQLDPRRIYARTYLDTDVRRSSRAPSRCRWHLAFAAGGFPI
jgi:hypothetical protein